MAATTKTYSDKVQALEAEGMTTSDAQAVLDAKPASRATRSAQPTVKAKAPTKGKASAKAGATDPSRARKAADSLPNRVRQHREKAALSPKELAAQIGGDWTASTVRRIERGARKPSSEQIARLADALRVPVADLGFNAEKPSKAGKGL